MAAIHVQSFGGERRARLAPLTRRQRPRGAPYQSRESPMQPSMRRTYRPIYADFRGAPEPAARPAVRSPESFRKIPGQSIRNTLEINSSEHVPGSRVCQRLRAKSPDRAERPKFGSRSPSPRWLCLIQFRPVRPRSRTADSGEAGSGSRASTSLSRRGSPNMILSSRDRRPRRDSRGT